MVWVRNLFLIVLSLFFLGGCDGSRMSTKDSAGGRPPLDFPRVRQVGNALLQHAMDTGEPSALSVALFYDGEKIWSESRGVIDRESGKPISRETLFPIASVSKNFAAVVAMHLAERHLLDLNAPVGRYLPHLSPEFGGVTVRMLLNHTSGLPEADIRSTWLSEPVQEAGSKVVDALRGASPVHKPGTMAVYNNTAFDLFEAVVAAATGQTFETYLQEQILKPLGLEHTRIPTHPFPEGSFAKGHHAVTGAPYPQEFPGGIAAGGLYSTPEDLCRYLGVFFPGPTPGKLPRILSQKSIEAMAVDQTSGTFRPLPEKLFRFGLGWDSVVHPAFDALGVRAFWKGGAIAHYTAEVLVLPDEKFAAAVTVSGKTNARVLIEQILLAALVDIGRIDSMPAALSADLPPVGNPSETLLSSISGMYAMGQHVLRVSPDTKDRSLGIFLTVGPTAVPFLTGLQFRSDGTFAASANPRCRIAFRTYGQERYLVMQSHDGISNYWTSMLYGQQKHPTTPLREAWGKRLGKHWLLASLSKNAFLWDDGFDPRLSLFEFPDLPGYLSFSRLSEASALPQRALVDPSKSDFRAQACLKLPMVFGQQSDLWIELRGGTEWLRCFDLVYRPMESIPQAAPYRPMDLCPSEEDAVMWVRISGDVGAVNLASTAPGRWLLYDEAFRVTARGTGSASIPTRHTPGFLAVMGPRFGHTSLGFLP